MADVLAADVVVVVVELPAVVGVVEPVESEAGHLDSSLLTRFFDLA